MLRPLTLQSWWGKMQSEAREPRERSWIRAPSSASVGLTDYSQVSVPDVWCNCFNLGAKESPTSPNWADQIDLPESQSGFLIICWPL